MNTRIVIGLIIMFFSEWVLSQEEPRIVPEKLTDNLYILYGGGGQGANVGLFIGKDEVTLVDGMKSETHEKLMAVIRSITDKPIKKVVNTHADFDHAGGNSLFMEKGAIVYMQENAPHEGGIGNVYFKDKLTLDLTNESIEIYTAVSHSFCDALIYFKQHNVVFMGDTFTNNWYATFNSGGVHGQFDAIDKALAIGNSETIYIPGHGLPSTVEGLMTYRKATGEWLSKVSELYRTGVSIDEMVKDEDLNRIKQKFIDERTGATIPQARLKRFIERTISIDLMPEYPIDPNEFVNYTGSFQYEDGTVEEIYVSKGKLLIRKKTPYQYISELIPQSESRFHLGGSINMWLEFQFENGAITGYQFLEGDKKSIARKVNQ